MDIHKYLETTEQKLSKYFDIKKPYRYKDLNMDLFAQSFIRNEKYFVTKKAIVYAFENNEYNFIKSYKNLDENQLNSFLDILKNATEDFVNPNNQHMSTVINGIIIVNDGFREDLKKIIEKFKFNRSFAFGFKGWSYIRLVVVDLNKGEVITNKRGKEVKKFYKVS